MDKEITVTVTEDPTSTTTVQQQGAATVQRLSTMTLEEELVRRRSGLSKYLKNNLRVVAAFVCGLSTVFLLFGFMYWLASHPVLDCAWFSNCKLSSQIIWVRDHMGLVQGISTFFYLGGLAGIAYTACRLCEAGVWVVLSQQPLTIFQLESYIAVAQGSILAFPGLVLAVKTLPTFGLLFFVVVSSLTPLAGAPMVGFIYEQVNATIQVQSAWVPGGGIGPIFAQTNPPTSVNSGAVSAYAAWSRGMTPEPLPDFRDWLVDRRGLAPRGNLTAKAVRLQKQVSCAGLPLQQNINLQEDVMNQTLEYGTNMFRQNGRGQEKNSSEVIKLRTFAGLNVWADSFSFINANRTSASLVFASTNGTIEGGITSTVIDRYVATISAIKCEIDIELKDDTLVIGDGGLKGPIATLSSNNGIHIGHCNSSSPLHGCTNPSSGAATSLMPGQPNTLNEVILWLTMSPILVGMSVDGTQPQFASQRPFSLDPLPYTSTDVINNTWTLNEIQTLIDVSVGAMATASSTNFLEDHQPITLVSTVYMRKPALVRVPLLFVPVSVMLFCVSCLALLNIYLHNKYNLPLMRGAPLREILRSMHTQYMHDLIDPDARNWHRFGALGDIQVKFGVAENVNGEVQVGLAGPGDVRPFEKKKHGRRSSTHTVETQPSDVSVSSPSPSTSTRSAEGSALNDKSRSPITRSEHSYEHYRPVKSSDEKLADEKYGFF